MTERRVHRLEGLEPNNILAFLALLGSLHALDVIDKEDGNAESVLRARAAWDDTKLPLRPCLYFARDVSRRVVIDRMVKGIELLAKAYDFGPYEKLKFSPEQARSELSKAAEKNEPIGPLLWSALISDVAAREKTVERTPLCLLDVAQTSFLKTLGFTASCAKDQGNAIERSLFHPWQWEDSDPKFKSFRWDPMEDVRHAYRFTAPTDDKKWVEKGANVLAAFALPLLTVVPMQSGSSVRLQMIGGNYRDGQFRFAWPIWHQPASLAAIRAMLMHGSLWKQNGLEHLGVDLVMESRRIQCWRYKNFTWASPLREEVQ